MYVLVHENRYKAFPGLSAHIYILCTYIYIYMCSRVCACAFVCVIWGSTLVKLFLDYICTYIYCVYTYIYMYRYMYIRLYRYKYMCIKRDIEREYQGHPTYVDEYIYIYIDIYTCIDMCIDVCI